MERRPGLCINDRNIALGMLLGDARAYDVARGFGCTELTIYRLQQRVRQTGRVNDRPWSGRPRITTPREDSYMVTSSRPYRFMPATKLVQRLRQATESLFLQQGIDSRPLGYELDDHTQAFPLRNGTESHAWIGHVDTTVGLGSDGIVFTDESKFNLNCPDGRVCVWRRRGERIYPANVVECDGYGGGSVMIWGGISYEGKTELKIVQGRLNTARYCADIILPAVVPDIHNGTDDVFQHVVIRLFTHVTSWQQTTLTRSNVLDHQNCHL